MITQMQLNVLFRGKSHGRPDFQKEKNNNKVVSTAALFFYVCTNVDNRERARASY